MSNCCCFWPTYSFSRGRQWCRPFHLFVFLFILLIPTYLWVLHQKEKYKETLLAKLNQCSQFAERWVFYFWICLPLPVVQQIRAHLHDNSTQIFYLFSLFLFETVDYALGHIKLRATPWTVAIGAPLSVKFPSKLVVIFSPEVLPSRIKPHVSAFGGTSFTIEKSHQENLNSVAKLCTSSCYRWRTKEGIVSKRVSCLNKSCVHQLDRTTWLQNQEASVSVPASSRLHCWLWA